MTPTHSTTTHRLDTALVVFTRLPSAERKRFGLGRADRCVAETLVATTLDTVAAAAECADVIVAVDGAADVTIAPAGARVVRQRGGGFEDRLLGVLRDVAALGYSRVVVVGTDTPTLTRDDIRAALDETRGRVTVGPSNDGGFYLLSIETSRVALLRGLPWQRSSLLSALVARLHGASVACSLLCRRRDVDDAVDARALQPLLERLSRRFIGTGLDGRKRAIVPAARRDIAALSFVPVDQGPPRSPPLHHGLAI